MSLDQPLLVVGLSECDQRLVEVLDGVEGPDPKQVFLQCPDEPFGAAVALSVILMAVTAIAILIIDRARTEQRERLVMQVDEGLR